LERQWWWKLNDATPSARRCLTVDAPWFPCSNNTNNNNNNNSTVVQNLSVVYPRTFGVVECGRAYTRAQTRWGPIVTWSAANASSWYTVLFIDTSDTEYVQMSSCCILSCSGMHHRKLMLVCCLVELYCGISAIRRPLVDIPFYTMEPSMYRARCCKTAWIRPKPSPRPGGKSSSIEVLNRLNSCACFDPCASVYSTMNGSFCSKATAKFPPRSQCNFRIAWNSIM
jgi:hypothetical protein